jgi:hypothetical protein
MQMPYLSFKNFFLAAAIIFLAGEKSFSQSPAQDSSSWLKGWNITATFVHGKIFKHTPKFAPAIETASNAFELSFSKQLHGRQAWEEVHHYPYLGIAAEYNDIGNDSVLGKAYWLLPFIEIPMVSGKKVSAYFRVGRGIAWLTKRYDAVENPTNNVIASHGNDITQFMMEVLWKPKEQLAFSFGASFTHYSTGAVRIPNLGINTPAWRVGIRYVPKPFSREEFLHQQLPSIPKKIFFTTQLGLGFQEAAPAHGPMYQVYLFELSVGRMIRRWDLISVGGEVNYKEAANAFIKQEEIYPDHFFTHSLAISYFVKNDFLFGNLGIAAYVGSFFYHPSPMQISFYQKIGQYYSFHIGGEKSLKRLTAGVYITAGNFTADFVSVDLGFRF